METTTLSFVCALFTALFFVTDHLIYGVATLLFTLIFDCADGQTARFKNLQSQFGHWYDYHTDKIKDVLFLFCLAFGFFLQTYNPWVLIFAFFAISFQFMRNITRLTRINFELQQDNKFAEKKSSASSQLLTVIKNSLLFKEADRYLLFIIFCLLDRVGLMIFLYMMIEFFFAISSAYINYKKFNEYDKLIK